MEMQMEVARGILDPTSSHRLQTTWMKFQGVDEVTTAALMAVLVKYCCLLCAYSVMNHVMIWGLPGF